MPSAVPFVRGQGVAVADTDTSLLDRPALLAALHQAAQNRLCVLHAPGGSGKSTLIAQYLPHSRQQQPVAWLRLGSAEQDAVQFFRQLSLAIRENIGGFAGFSSLQRHGSNTIQQAELASQIFLNALTSLQQPLQIIIDNVELLVECSWLPLLQRVIRQSPSQVRWLLSGRNTQGIDPSRWQPQESVPVFTPQQLFFDETDTRRLLSEKQNHALDDALIKQLHQHTKGWPAALKLAQVYLRHHDAQQPIPESLFGRAIFTDLFDPMLDALPVQLRQFLVNIAFLEHFSVPLCDYVFNSLHSEQLIDQIKHLGLFVEMDTHPGIYTLHTLFREHLQEHFSLLPAEERERLVTRACLWLVDKGERQKACQLSYRHLQRSFFLELLRQSFREWFRAGEAAPVFYWAHELGEDTLQDCPELHFAWSWALLMFGEFAAAEKVIQRTLATPLPDSPWDALLQSADTPQTKALSIMFAIIRLFKGDMDTALIGQLQKLYNSPSLPNTLRATIDNIFARYSIMQCQFSEARQRASQALKVMEQTRNHLGYSLSAYLIANACYQNNDIKTAGQLCRQPLDNPNLPHGATARALLEGFSAFLHYQSDQPLLAEQRIHDVLLAYQPGYSIDLQLFLTLPLLHLKTRRGEFADAELLLQQLEHAVHANESSQAQAHALYERVRLAYARRDRTELARLDTLHSLVTRAHTLLNSDDHRLTWEQMERHVMAAILILLDQGKLEQAYQWMQQLQYCNVERGYPIRFLPLNVCLAYLEFRLGRISAAFRRLNDSLSQAEATGMLTGLLDDIPDLDDFVCTAIRQQRIQNPAHRARLLALGILNCQDGT